MTEATKGIPEKKLNILTYAAVCSSEMGMHIRTVGCFETTHDIRQHDNDITTTRVSYDLIE